jgi:hypothetical protein
MRVLKVLPLAAVVAIGVAPAARADGGHGGGGGPLVSVVAKNLNSPRHLAFGARGDLFVAEAGTGGPTTACFAGGEGPACWGPTGSVTKVDRWGRQSRIATGLPSMSNTPNLDNAIGPHGILVLGHDTVVITNGGPTEPKDLTTGATIQRETLAATNKAANLFGKVLLIGPRGNPLPLADIYAFERAVNPDKAGGGNPAVDSNPVGIIRDGLRFVVADAGGNALDTVDLFGRVRNLTVFPNVDKPNPFAPPGSPLIPMQAVPTSVVKGRDGAYYMTQLTGFPFPAGAASIWRVNPRTGEKTVFATGFTNLMDLAVARDGTIYALEIDHDSLLGPSNEGALFAIDRRGNKRQITLPAGTIPFPGGLALGDDGIYVSINGGSPGGGGVVRLKVR